LKGLEDIISFTAVHYHFELPNSWRFVRPEEEIPMEGCTPDPLHPGTEYMTDLYLRAAPNYTGRFSVPVLWDKQEDTIVNNESSEIIRMFYTEFDELLPEKYRGVDLYPEPLRKDIDLTNEWIYDNINNGV
jgi:glutathionyl-hydroquinone reductase